MFRIDLPAMVVSVLLFAPAQGVLAETKEVSQDKTVSLSQAEKRMNGMANVLKKILKELADARSANDVRRVNCLTLKLNTVKGLVRASEKARVVMLEASYSADAVTSQSFGQKIMRYGENVDEIEKTIDECSGAEVKSDGTTLVYVRPEGVELDVTDSSSWASGDNVGGVEPYPVVPPASPFR